MQGWHKPVPLEILGQLALRRDLIHLGEQSIPALTLAKISTKVQRVAAERRPEAHVGHGVELARVDARFRPLILVYDDDCGRDRWRDAGRVHADVIADAQEDDVQNVPCGENSAVHRVVVDVV